MISRPEDLQTEIKAVQKRSNQRHPKSRDKWSLLWWISVTILNGREETSDGKKGKRFGFDRFTQLSCKRCKISFHSKETLVIHKDDIHGSKSSTDPVFSSSYHRPRVCLLSSDNDDDMNEVNLDLKKLLECQTEAERKTPSPDEVNLDLKKLLECQTEAEKKTLSPGGSLFREEINKDLDNQSNHSHSIECIALGDSEEDDEDTMESEIPLNFGKYVKITPWRSLK